MSIESGRARLKSDDERHEPCSDEEFVTLVHRQSRFVFRIAYAVVRNNADAEEVVQEVFLKLYRTGGWRQMKDEKAYLARTGWRLAIQRLPRRKNDESDFEIVSRELVSRALNPEQETIAADWNWRLHRLIDALPEELRQPLALSAFEELSSPQIAAVMGIPEGTVRTRLARARQLLKEKSIAMLQGPHAK